ncbi:MULTISPECIES: hypothetical protein [unclassified Vibrio]|nr:MULTISPECIES: hypothetical protein [unclassified Vibrio]MDW1590221.1 hypothetical protein [Vibrio sp. Vb2944]MDW1609283.1 hypothetical protein [Vibrio sp. Vb2908]MDW1723856.1 hypothetical protein [Vibrio sp. Vb2909]
MTQNIEQRTLAATSTLESSARSVDEIAHTDKDVFTPVGKRKSFPKIAREWDSESERLKTQWRNDSGTLREDWHNERNELSTKALGVKPWEAGLAENNLNQQRRWTDNNTYLPKVVPATMAADGPDDNWIPYTADKSDTLTDVFGRKPIELLNGVVLTPDTDFNYPKMSAFGKIWELNDGEDILTVSSFEETMDGHLVITLDTASQVIAHKMMGASRSYAEQTSLTANELLTKGKVYPKNLKRGAYLGETIPEGTISVIIAINGDLHQLVLDKAVSPSGALSSIGDGYLVIGTVKYIALPVQSFDADRELNLDDSMTITRSGRFHGLMAKLFGADKPAVKIGGENGKATKGFVCSGLRMQGDTEQPTNNNAVMTVSSVDGAILTEHEVEDGYNSFSLEYGQANINGDRRSINSVVSSYIARGAYMGFEMFSNAFCSVAGLVASRSGRERGKQHGFRITGYGKNHLNQGHDLRNRGNNYSGLVSHNYANGVSQQTGAYHNNVSFSATDGENGLHFTENTTLADAISRSNTHTFAIGGMNYGAYLHDPLCSSFRGTIDECLTYGFFTKKSTRRAESNAYDLTFSNANKLSFDDSYSRIYITAKELIGGCTINGSYNIIDIVVDENNFEQTTQNAALRIAGHKNIIRAIAHNVKQPFSEIIISGDGNDLTASLDTTDTKGKVALTGNNNVVRGQCNIGTVTGIGNDYSGVVGFYCRGKKVVSVVNGRGFIDVEMKTSAYVVALEPYLPGETRTLRFQVVSVSVSQIVFDVYDKNDVKVDGDFTVMYEGKAYQ